MTRVLLASQLALPGCALAMARRLRRCAIGQEVSQKAYTFMQDLTFTLIIPVLYLILREWTDRRYYLRETDMI